MGQQHQLLQQLQQQQLALQLVQQQAQQNLHLQMMQQPSIPRPAQPSEQAGIPQASAPLGNDLTGPQANGMDTDSGRSEAMLSNALSRMAFTGTQGSGQMIVPQIGQQHMPSANYGAQASNYAKQYPYSS